MSLEKKENKLKFIYKILILINIIFSTSILLSYLSVYVNPEKFSLIAIFGLFYPFILILNVLMLVLWVFLRKKYYLISLITILFGWNMLRNSIQIDLIPEDTNEDSLKILSYNVRMFDKYNWIKEEGTTEEILEFIEKQSADVVCIQEFYSNKKDGANNEKRIKEFDKSKYSHIIFRSKGAKIYNFGLATFSNYPIINKGSIKYGDNVEIAIYSDIVFKTDTIRFYNCHLESVHFAYDDYHFIDSITVNENNINQLKRLKKIIVKLISAYEIRCNQADLILEHITQTNYPVVVCGDFNDTPVSYVYHKIRKNLEDAFIESGYGLGSSYVYRFMRLRIDYILHDKKLRSANFTTKKVKLSDHYPVSCELYLN